MSDLSEKINRKKRGFHRNTDGSWGTDDHDADILKGIAAAIGAIGPIVLGVAGAKKGK